MSLFGSSAGERMLASIGANKIDPLIAGTPFGTAVQGALEFRQPVLDAVLGVDDEKAIVDMLGMYLLGKLTQRVSSPPPGTMPRNGSSVIAPEQSRVKQLYDAL